MPISEYIRMRPLNVLAGHVNDMSNRFSVKIGMSQFMRFFVLQTVENLLP